MAGVAWLLYVTVFVAKASKQPNILFLNVDEMDGRNMDPTSPDEYNAIEMPKLRSMASLGTQFIRHYTNGPQCVCGRSVLWTGRRTNDIHVYNNAFGIASLSNGSIDTYCSSTYTQQKCEQMRDIQAINYTILDAMQSLGYDVYIYGKLHIGAGIMDLPSQSNATDEAFEAAHNPNSMASITRSANIHKPTQNSPMQAYNDNVADPHSADEQIIGKCLQRLQSLGSSKDTQTKPFMLYCSVDIPHPPYQTNSTWLKYVDVHNITIPPNLNQSKYNAFDEYTAISEDGWNANWTDQQIIDFRKTYYGLNAQTDYMLGEVMDALFANGFSLNDTYIVFTSDHGEMNLDHRQYGKNSMYEGSTRIPLFIAGPNVLPQQTVTNLTEMIDILPTLIDIAGGDGNHIPVQLPGVSLMPFVNGSANSSDHADYVTSQYHSLKANTGSFMVRKGKWKYIQYGHYLSAYKNYEAQLFDLESDPNEVDDVSAENENVVNEMEQILKQTYDYEYADCVAKKQDMEMFNEFVWNKYNQTQVYDFLKQTYHGFDDTDWQTVVSWRNELMNADECDSLNM